jgi:hypothetical protein
MTTRIASHILKRHNPILSIRSLKQTIFTQSIQSYYRRSKTTIRTTRYSQEALAIGRTLRALEDLKLAREIVDQEIVAMGSDEDYEAFLNKANADSNEASAQSTSKTSSKKSNAVNTSSVPFTLQSVDAYYTSDADEPFEPVSLSYDGKSVPSASELSELTGKEAESISKKDFEAGGSYGEVVEAVEKASKGKVGFFRVELGGTRSEVWVVGVDGKGSLVGLKAVAILS